MVGKVYKCLKSLSKIWQLQWFGWSEKYKFISYIFSLSIDAAPYTAVSCEAYCFHVFELHTLLVKCHLQWKNCWWFRVFNDVLVLIFSFCVSLPALLRNTNMTIIWICVASVTGLVTFLAFVICRKRQEEYFELSAFISPALFCYIMLKG